MAEFDRIVVLGSSLTALAIVRAAKALRIASVLLDTRRGIAFDSRHPIPIYCPGGNDEFLLQQLEGVASKQSTALIADSDGWLRFIVRCRPALESMFASVLHPGPRAIELCLDKSLFLDWCMENDFAAPRRYGLEAATNLLPSQECPLLLRPEITRHELAKSVPKAIEVRSRAELDRWLEQFAAAGVTPSIAQSLLRPGPHEGDNELIRSQTQILRRRRRQVIMNQPAQRDDDGRWHATESDEHCATSKKAGTEAPAEVTAWKLLTSACPGSACSGACTTTGNSPAFPA